jgi:hypothetical protein
MRIDGSRTRGLSLRRGVQVMSRVSTQDGFGRPDGPQDVHQTLGLTLQLVNQNCVRGDAQSCRRIVLFSLQPLRKRHKVGGMNQPPESRCCSRAWNHFL